MTLLTSFNVTGDNATFTSTPSSVFDKLFVSFLEVKSLLSEAFNCCGYVAGGFANLASDVEQANINHYDVRQLIHDMTSCSLMTATQIANVLALPISLDSYKNSPKLSGATDIDLFFEREASRVDFISYALKNGWYQKQSKFSINLLKVNCPLIQVTMLTPAPIRTILKSFDIFNCAVAFNEREIIKPDGYEDLERAGILHVMKWSEWTHKRVMKYFVRKHSVVEGSDGKFKKKYLLLTDATRANFDVMIDKEIDEYMKKVEDLKAQQTGPFINYVNSYALKKLLPFVSAEKLLLAGVLTSNPDSESYQHIDLGIQELITRQQAASKL